MLRYRSRSALAAALLVPALVVGLLSQSVTAASAAPASAAVTASAKAPSTYRLHYAAHTGGTVTGLLEQRVKPRGSGHTVKAVAKTGYRFSHWTGGSTSVSRRDIHVTKSVFAGAFFMPLTFVLRYSADAGGSVTGTATQRVNYGTNGTAVTAVAATGYRFTGWSDGVATATRTERRVTANLSATAQFARIQVSLHYAAGTHGTLEGDADQTVPYGEDGAAVTAVPDAGYHFVAWSDGSTDDPRIDLAATADLDVTAQFARTTASVTYTAGTGGSLTGDTAQQLGDGDQGTAVTAVPDTGYRFVQWSDGSTENPRTDMGTGSAQSFAASFAPLEYSLAYSADAHGTIDGDAAQTVLYDGDGASVTAVPDAGYRFIGWSDGSTENPRTDVDVTADVSVIARFEAITYSFSYTAGAHGTIDGAAHQTVVQGDDGSAVTAVPATGYEFTSWSDGSTDNPRTDLDAEADLAVTASFRVRTFSLAYAADAHGSISGAASQTVDYGTDGAAVTAVADTGYEFTGWSDGSTANPRTDSDVTADLSVTAQFGIRTFDLAYAADAHGSISGPATQTVDYDADGAAVTAVPDAGYDFTGWSDGSTANPRTDTAVTADVTVTAHFALRVLDLEYSAGAHGSLTGTTSQHVDYGSNGTAVTAVPDSGYLFSVWSDGSTDNPRTDVDVHDDLAVTAQFVPDAIVLAAGDSYRVPAGSAKVAVANVDSSTASYLLVASASGSSATTMSVTAHGTIAPTVSRASATGSDSAAGASILTQQQDAYTARVGTTDAAAPLTPASRIPDGVVPSVGDTWTLNNGLTGVCSSGRSTTGTVTFVGTHVIVVVDSSNPVGGAAGTEWNTALTALDETVYPAVTEAFGAPSDIDHNDRVVVFVTKAINELTAPASPIVVGTGTSEYRTTDLLSQSECSTSNAGEIVYALAADPTGAVNANVRTASYATGNLGPEFARQLATMIVDERQIAEGRPFVQGWVADSLGFLAQEEVFYAASVGLAPRGDIVVSQLTTGVNASKRVAAFNTYANGNFGRLRAYLQSIGSVAAFSDSGAQTLGRQGAQWAFLRYAIDSKIATPGGSDAAAISAILAAPGAGLDRIGAALGVDAAAWSRDFSASMYLDDMGTAGSAGISGAFANPSWNFPSLYTALGGNGVRNYALTAETPLTLTLAGTGAAGLVTFGLAGGTTGSLDLTLDPRQSYTLVRIG